MRSGYSKTPGRRKTGDSVGQANHNYHSLLPGPLESQHSLLSFLPLPRSFFSVLKTSSSIPRAFLVCKMMALACLNFKGPFQYCLFASSLSWFYPWIYRSPVPCPLPPPPITFILSPATRKAIKGEVWVEPENVDFTFSLRMFDLRKVSKQ